MAGSRQPNREEDAVERTEYMYRGRKIEVQGRKREDHGREIERHGDHEGRRLFIDGQEIAIEETENGVLSHAFMFKEFGTPAELAEALIQQWGEARLENPSHAPGQPHHPHAPDQHNH
jgi:hypothetical protein